MEFILLRKNPLMKTFLLTSIILLTGLLNNISAAEDEYLVQINLNLNIDQLNKLESLMLPVLLLQDDYLITTAAEDQLNKLKTDGINYVKLDKEIASTEYAIVTRKNLNINPTDFLIELLFIKGTNGIALAESINRDLLRQKGYSVTFPVRNNFFHNKKTISRYVNDLTTDSLISVITELINKDSVQYFIQKLQDFQTRFLFASNRDSVSEWIRGEFLRMGYTDVKLDSFQYQNTTQKNVVATLPGTVQPNRFVVTGGHHDSYSSGNPLVFAPGADDNASGTAAVLETARVLKAAGYQSELTIKFITFAAEEYGLWGSVDYAQKAVNDGMDIKLMINHDMISHTLHQANESNVDINYYSGCESYRELAKQMVGQYSILTPLTGSPNSSGSDSYSFWTQGYQAIYFEETNFSPYYHSINDIISNYNMEYCAEVIKGSCATLLTVVKMPDMVNNFALYDLGTGNSVLAEWSPNNEPDFSYYKIYTGLSSGNYYTNITTTDTTAIISALEDGTPYFIAISVVDQDGNESLLVERSIIPRSLPLAPGNVSALPEWHQVRLKWMKNIELDLQGYNIYRSLEQTGNFTKINQSVITDTTFVDNTAQSVQFYFYYIKAIDTDNNESNPSNTVKSRVISLDQGILIVDETEDGTGTLLYPTDEQVDSFYEFLLDGFRHQMYDINNDGLPTLADIGAFSTVIWSSEDGSNITAALDSRDVLKSFMEYGGNFIYSGYKPSRAFFQNVVYPYQMEPGTFLYDMLKIRDLKYTVQARFYGGVPIQSGYNYISVDTMKTLSSNLYHLSNIESIDAAPSGQNIYYYDTKYDSASPQGSMKGLPVGVEYIGTDYSSVTLSFPLYYMKESEAKNLIYFILTEKFNELTDVTDQTAEVPVEYTLSQNYPNPFNPATMINYSIPFSAKVNLSVYDILGRETAVLVDGNKDAGYYSAFFDGAGLSSGIYFYKLHVQPDNGSKGFNETRKMILLK